MRVTDGRGFALGMVDSTSGMACSVNNRGEMVRVRGASGVADKVMVCDKTTSDTYAWREIGAAASSSTSTFARTFMLGGM